MFKLPEAAQRLGVSIDTARRYVRKGDLPSAYIGGTYRISEEDLDAFVESRRGAHPKGSSSIESGTRPPEEIEMSDGEFSKLLDTLNEDGLRERQLAIQRYTEQIKPKSPHLDTPEERTAWEMLGRCNMRSLLLSLTRSARAGNKKDAHRLEALAA